MTPPTLSSPPARVLIVKPSAIGDVVHALPVLKLLKDHWPAAKFSWLVTPACAGILDGHPLLHEVIRFDRKKYGSSWRRPKVLRSLLQFALDLRSRRFDIAIDLQGLFRSGWLTFESGAPVRIGLSDAREMATLFYTRRISVPRGEQVHAIDRYLRVPQALGAKSGPVEFLFADSVGDHAFVAERTPERYALMFPGTNWPTKRWPVAKFAELAQRLRERFNLPTVVGGGPNERELAAQIPGTINLAGQTTLNQLVALIRRADVVVSNDSGPMHIAAALNKPLVAPFGPTNPFRTGPYRRLDSVIKLDIVCSPCYSRTCSHQSCLQNLEVGPVLEVAAAQMRK
jgi:lipopolysaccharide heptosyltransferase I